MYTIYVKFDCLPQKREAFIQKVTETGILAAVRAENGCIRYDYYFSAANEDEVFLFEEWTSQAHQQIHMNQPHMPQLRQIKEKYIENTVLRIL